MTTTLEIMIKCVADNYLWNDDFASCEKLADELERLASEIREDINKRQGC